MTYGTYPRFGEISRGSDSDIIIMNTFNATTVVILGLARKNKNLIHDRLEDCF